MPSIANVKALGLSFTTQAIDQLPKIATGILVFNCLLLGRQINSLANH